TAWRHTGNQRCGDRPARGEPPAETTAVTAGRACSPGSGPLSFGVARISTGRRASPAAFGPAPTRSPGMAAQELSGTTALVTGASRGFGRGIATALSKAGANVVGVARDRARLEELRAQLGGTFTPLAADAADPVVAGQLTDKYHPRTLVLNAGATPLTRPLHEQTWQTFSRNWEVDVQHAYHWTREALVRPLHPGSVVIAVSSGAALRGSPLSGGYAGAKATIRFLTSYAASESER